MLCLFSCGRSNAYKTFPSSHTVPAGPPSRGGDVVVNVFDINHLSLLTPFDFVLLSISVSMALSTVFHSVKFSRQLSAFSLCSSDLVSASLVLSIICLFMKVSLNLDTIFVIDWA